MGRIILGAVVGFIVWTILLIGSDAVWLAFSPDWYGKHQTALQEAIKDQTPFMADSAILLVAVIRSAVFSVIAGIVASLISKETFKSPLLLGIFLLAFGAFIHSLILNNVPIWYHFGILLPLVPMTILGAKIK